MRLQNLALRTKKKERKKDGCFYFYFLFFYANNKEDEEYGFIYILVQNVVKNFVSSFELKKKKKEVGEDGFCL